MVDKGKRCQEQRILVIVGHPRAGSLTDALAEAYGQAAKAAGADVRVLKLRELKFDLNVVTSHINEQPLEADLLRAQEWLQWCGSYRRLLSDVVGRNTGTAERLC